MYLKLHSSQKMHSSDRDQVTKLEKKPKWCHNCLELHSASCASTMRNHFHINSSEIIINMFVKQTVTVNKSKCIEMYWFESNFINFYKNNNCINQIVSIIDILERKKKKKKMKFLGFSFILVRSVTKCRKLANFVRYNESNTYFSDFHQHSDIYFWHIKHNSSKSSENLHFLMTKRFAS